MKIKLFLALVILMIVFPAMAYAHADSKQKAGEQTKVLTNRGCPACHIKISEEQNYAIAHEAKDNAKNHPKKSSSGVILDDDTTADTCLECHAAAANGRGKKAPLSLRDIVHPAHNFSPVFAQKLNGNCFSCHDIDKGGKWNLLTLKVETNNKGISKAAPIPGAIAITKEEKEANVPMNTFLIAVAVLGLLNLVSLGLSSKRK